MSKIERLKKRFTAFVNQLTPDQVREQLVLAYLQMENCQKVLKGYDVEPETMMDNGESSDLELFYRCKKAAEELAYLNKMVHDGKKVGTLVLEVKIDTRHLQNELDKIKLRDYIKPTGFHLEPFLRFKEELPRISESLQHVGTKEMTVSYEKRNETFIFDNLENITKFTIGLWHLKDLVKKSENRNPDWSGFLFAKGQEVWYMFGDRVQHSTIEYPMRDADGVTIYKTKLGHETAECETFGSLEELMGNLKKTVNE